MEQKKMNMISTGAFLNEMDASDKQPSVAEKFAAVWEKKNAKAARAGGVSLMALSLAACGSSSTTTTTTTTDTTTTDTTTTTTDAAKVIKLTAVDDVATGGSGDDIFDAYSNAASYSAADTIDGGEGSDTLILHTAAALTPITTSVETLSLRDTGGVTTTLSKMSGLEHVIVDASTATTTLGKFTTGMSLTIQNTGTVDTVATMTGATGAADTLVFNIKGDNGDLTADGIETLTVTGAAYAGSTGASMDMIDSDTLSSITLTSSVLTDLGLLTTDGTGNDDAEHITIDASGATGGFKADISHFDGTSTGGQVTGNTVTGSAAADTLAVDAADIDKYETYTMGAGDDTLKINDEVNDSGGHTLVKADFANISGFTRLELGAGTESKGGSGDSLDLSDTGGLAWVKTIVVGSDTDHLFDNMRGDMTIEVTKSTTVNKIDTESYVAGTHATTLDMKGAATVTDLDIINAGTLTINSVGAAANVITTIASTTAATINVTGSAGLTLTNALGTSTATFNAEAATGAISVTASTTASNITGGSAGDTLTGGSAADVISGGAGNDTIDGAANSDVIDAGAGNDTIAVTNHATQYDTITTGSGKDIITYDGAATSFASVVVKDMDFGTSSTTVDSIKLDLTDVNLLVGSSSATVLKDTDGTNISADVALTVKTVTTDGAAIAGADIVVLSNTYATEATALAGMATAGNDTFLIGSTADHGGLLVAWSDGTDSYLGVAWQATASAITSSDGFEGIDTMFTFEGISDLSVLNGTDILIV